MIKLIDYLDELNRSLEEKGWFSLDNVVDRDMCEKIIAHLKVKEEQDLFKKAAVSRGYFQKIKDSIRKSHVFWINDWGETEELKYLEIILKEMMLDLNQHFFLAMRRIESQLAIYPKGGFYKKHLDQHKKTKHRQVSFILYLNDCLDGGELNLYNKDDKNKLDAVIKPKMGTIVLFFSRQIYHEVKTVHSERMSLSTWFRDDEIIPFL